MAFLIITGPGLAMAVVLRADPAVSDHEPVRQPTAEVAATYSPPARKNWGHRFEGDQLINMPPFQACKTWPVDVGAEDRRPESARRRPQSSGWPARPRGNRLEMGSTFRSWVISVAMEARATRH